MPDQDPKSEAKDKVEQSSKSNEQKTPEPQVEQPVEQPTEQPTEQPAEQSIEPTEEPKSGVEIKPKAPSNAPDNLPKIDLKNKKVRNRSLLIIIAAAIALGLALQIWSGNAAGGLLNNSTQPDELSTSEFVTAVKDNKVIEANYNASDVTLNGKYLKDGETDPEKAAPYISKYLGNDSLNELMDEHPEIKFNIIVAESNWFMNILVSILPMVLLFAFMWFLFSQMNKQQNKQMGFGKTKGQKTAEERPKTKFSDVAGIDEAVEELQEVKDFLADPKKYEKYGAKIPRGVLLVGPPGTGKTLLARAVAGEAGVPFFSISGSDFVEMFVGVGASRVRDLFGQAKKAAPAIIFIDEIDAVGRQRGAGLGGGHDEREQTLNQLLVEMDGFDEKSTVILIAATNRADVLDPALLRPGRFDRQVVVDRPDLSGREAILKVHSEGKPLASDVELSKLASMTAGFTGADLANLLNESALLAARRNKPLITNSEVGESIERVIAGPERKSRIMTAQEKRTIAFHEAGHALVGHVLEHPDPVHKISIISRGQALGYTMSLPTEDKFLKSRNSLLDELAVFMGGRVAEEIFIGDITTGASNDLDRATKMARQMVMRFGMSEALGNQVYGEANHEVFLGRDWQSTPDYSDETAKNIDAEVQKIMRTAHDRALKLLNERAAQMRVMADVLLERETVEGAALNALLDNKWDEFLKNEPAIVAQEKKDAATAIKQQAKDPNAVQVETSGNSTPLKSSSASIDISDKWGQTPNNDDHKQS